ncbi:MAG: hypothetical protein IT452_01280 [Planctomycetia bacterium]|nr:hypothetical protein [Planctomycetia bacterium]
MLRATLVSAAVLMALPARAGDGLADPVCVEADGRPIDLADGTGHAAPLVTDWDGDGLPDLLVGQFQGGYLRIYRNGGQKGARVFGAHTWFEAGGERAKVETG